MYYGCRQVCQATGAESVTVVHRRRTTCLRSWRNKAAEEEGVIQDDDESGRVKGNGEFSLSCVVMRSESLTFRQKQDVVDRSGVRPRCDVFIGYRPGD